MNIIFIDDDFEELDFMRLGVEAVRPEAHCNFFTDCDEALSALARMTSRPDYIFMEVNMNKIDGDECLVQLGRNQKIRSCKVVMMSSSMDMYEQSHQRAFLNRGAFAIVEKPGTVDEYAEMFANIVGSENE